MEDEENSETNCYSKICEKNQPFKIDFESLFGSDHDEPLPEVVVVPHAAVASEQRQLKEKRKKLPSNSSSSGEDHLARMSEYDLNSAINRMIRCIDSMGNKLPDRGAKLKASLQSHQEEMQRRKLRLCEEDASGHKKSAQSAHTSLNGALDGPKQSAPLSQPTTLEDNVKPKMEQNTGDHGSNAFDHEISCLSRNDQQKRKPGGRLQQNKRAKPGMSSKEFFPWKPSKHSHDSEKYMPLTGNVAVRASSPGSSTEKDACQASCSDESKNEKTVVLVDEEEAEIKERKQEAEELPSSTNEVKIYYPSREDPESLEILRSELKCLEPRECLTSTIMNFYIRFLQELWSPTDRSQHNFYFFNTYFYSKLQKAVAYRGSDKEAFFTKFRRWWRGVNIFQKAYVFLPINEDTHWSLVIICIPDKEDHSGPIILHLDSLGLHSSRSIFDNIRRLLKNEWEYLNENDTALDIPISDKIWKYLPRRIDEKVITVPRQTNDYDCGLFVLYYMERFIQEAPDRLKRQHLNMFGKNWFKPQEASSLRGKIEKILLEEFHKASRDSNGIIWKPVHLSANAETPKTTDGQSKIQEG